MAKPNLKSSTNKIGSTTTQIIGYASGNRKTFEGVISSSIKQSQYTQFKTVNGPDLVYVNHNLVEWIEIFKEKKK